MLVAQRSRGFQFSVEMVTGSKKVSVSWVFHNVQCAFL